MLIDCVVVETCDVLGSVAYLAGLQVLDCLGCSLPFLTELFEVVNSHQDSGQLRNLAQLLAGSFLLGILQFVFLAFNLPRFCFKPANLVVKSHDCFSITLS